MRVDKITMATSVEARVPFLDHKLVEYTLSLPRALKVEGASGKHILKRALEEILPRDLLYSPKRGFGAPVREWFRNGLAGWFDSHLMNSTMRRAISSITIRSRAPGEHRRGTHEWGFHLGVAQSQPWYERGSRELLKRNAPLVPDHETARKSISFTRRHSVRSNDALNSTVDHRFRFQTKGRNFRHRIMLSERPRGTCDCPQPGPEGRGLYALVPTRVGDAVGNLGCTLRYIPWPEPRAARRSWVIPAG